MTDIFGNTYGFHTLNFRLLSFLLHHTRPFAVVGKASLNYPKQGRQKDQGGRKLKQKYLLTYSMEQSPS